MTNIENETIILEKKLNITNQGGSFHYSLNQYNIKQ